MDGSENRGPEKLLFVVYLSEFSDPACRPKQRQRSQRRKDSKKKAEEQQSEINTGSPHKEVQHRFTSFCSFVASDPSF
jgi:hypothetical protein